MVPQLVALLEKLGPDPRDETARGRLRAFPEQLQNVLRAAGRYGPAAETAVAEVQAAAEAFLELPDGEFSPMREIGEFRMSLEAAFERLERSIGTPAVKAAVRAALRDEYAEVGTRGGERTAVQYDEVGRYSTRPSRSRDVPGRELYSEIVRSQRESGDDE